MKKSMGTAVWRFAQAEVASYVSCRLSRLVWTQKSSNKKNRFISFHMASHIFS